MVLLRDSAQAHRDHEEDRNEGGDNASGRLDDDAPSGREEECHDDKGKEDVMPKHSKILNESAGVLRVSITLRRYFGSVNRKHQTIVFDPSINRT